MEDYWVTISAGEFQMGTTGERHNQVPAHNVYLDTFKIGRYEITNRQYKQCVKAGYCSGISDMGDETDLEPVVNISWYDAQAFCSWICGRLPTEAEWEKAARGGLEGNPYPWGLSAPICNKDQANGANYWGIDGSCPHQVLPIGQYTPNGYGLYDMIGNVWEWVNDWAMGDYYYIEVSPLTNPTGPNSGDSKIVRGGSWNDAAVTVDELWAEKPETVSIDIGFRCARDSSP